MELSYWESRWRKGKTGFHMPDGYPGLAANWDKLNLRDKPVVLVPLCGKSIDLITLEKFGAHVIGVEISEIAIMDFLDSHNWSYETDTYGDFTIYKAGEIEFWQGDFFKFPKNKLPVIDLIYDKAALTAMPPESRPRYAKTIKNLSGKATKILLHHFIYPQAEMPGPPFSILEAEIKNLFSENFKIQMLEENTLPAKNFPPFQHRGLVSPLIERLLCLIPHS